jgi:hypothetical protein
MAIGCRDEVDEISKGLMPELRDAAALTCQIQTADALFA